MMSSQEHIQNESLRIELTVISGPDVGMSRSFVQSEISIGRAPDNDFVLSDGFVSGRHATIATEEEGGSEERQGLLFRDLDSRHGSLVSTDKETRRLHREGERADTLKDGCEVQVGCTLIKVEWEEVEPPPVDESLEATADEGEEEGNDKVITQALEPVQSLEQRFEGEDERLAVLFQLAGELNGRTALDEILHLVVDATFEAFPNANFFAITLVSEPEEVGEQSPFFTRVRGDLPDYEKVDEEPILSTSILEHVVTNQESVLFLKDSIGANVTESILEAEITSSLCAPLVGQRSLLGVMEVDTRGQGGVFSRRDLDLFSVLASNVAFAIERAELSNNIVEMFESFVAASVNAIEARDPTTAGHSERVTEYTLEFARVVNELEEGPGAEIALGEEEMRELRYATLLHDFGKIAVQESVLQKAKRLEEEHLDRLDERLEKIEALGFEKRVREAFDQGESLGAESLERIDEEQQAFADWIQETRERIRRIANAPSVSDEQLAWIDQLADKSFVDEDGEEHAYLTEFERESLSIEYGTLNDEEWEQVKSHPAHSERFLERIPWSEELERIPTMAGAHHEKLDGSGYPKGLTTDELIPQVRMMTIADIFDALTASDRPYRDAYNIERAVDILEAEADNGKLDAELVEVFIEKVLPRIRSRIPKTQ
jgi:3',5'-cyclic-nucleotide phosphodiesterase